MNLLKKTPGFFVFTAAMLLVIASVIINKTKFDKTAAGQILEQSIAVQEKTAAVATIPAIKPKKITAKIPLEKEKKDTFKTNDEIVEEYGKLETVILKNGESYTGAVVIVNGVYSIVTVEGKINIPMKDIKDRFIIR
ncbi:MAG: hypothetical protein GY754_08955 [bacterium]|nr:hypothetical protein [bacterium]